MTRFGSGWAWLSVADGEYIGRTPVTIKVMPGALSVVVP